MRIKLDENLPETLVAQLARLGHDVDTVRAENLTSPVDEIIWAAAQREHRFLITQDLDFSDARQFRPATHEGLLLVRMKSPGRLALLRRITTVFETEDVESWRACFVVVTERKIRIRRPPRP